MKEGRPDTKQHKRLARFTASMIKTKANQLLQEYCTQSLKAGRRPLVPQLRSRWFRGWRKEYGLSMRKPNRKYKVPKDVMAQRLEIGWLNVARVRALCLAEFGYDPEIENWDQSPFHHNESGSRNMPTLAVAGNGAIVPLIEGHSATRERWTVDVSYDVWLEESADIPVTVGRAARRLNKMKVIWETCKRKEKGQDKGMEWEWQLSSERNREKIATLTR